ncbi:unnamed protein product [Polarella glacialis]|nr:unnamed protein product [Polarella glacialis]
MGYDDGARSRLQKLKSIDAFRQPRQEALGQETWLGLGLTSLAAVLCIALFLAQLNAFLFARGTSRLEIDSDQSELLRVHFDVTMLDVACDYATIGVFDAFGNVRSNVTRDVQKQAIDHEGADKGHPFTDEELTELEFGDRPQLSAEERATLDADWTSLASGHFQLDDFQQALDAHEFVFVFYCVPEAQQCNVMLQAWMNFSADANSGQLKLHDADGAVADIWGLQVNCASEAFQSLCEDEKVDGVPKVRLYPRTVSKQGSRHFIGLNFVFPMEIIMMSMVSKMPPVFMQRLTDQIVSKAEISLKQRHLHTHATHHNIFKEGCRLRGHLDVPRVPGTLHFEARSASDYQLNYAYTNVSHTVNHLSFGRPGGHPSDTELLLSLLPAGYAAQQAQPLEGRSFVSEHFHLAAHHYVKVVHTRLESDESVRLYLYMHQWNWRTYPRHEPPKTKISYDVSPLEVVASHSRRWYDFATSTLAIVGGAFSSVQILYGLLSSVSTLGQPGGRKVDVL